MVTAVFPLKNKVYTFQKSFMWYIYHIPIHKKELEYLKVNHILNSHLIRDIINFNLNNLSIKVHNLMFVCVFR
jgi:hypothetical protein